MRPSHVTAVLLSLTPLASAFPWPSWMPEIDSLVVRRQDSSSSTSSATATATAEASASATSTDPADQTDLNTAGQTATSTDSSASGTGTASATGTGTATDKDTTTKSKSTSSTSINAEDPAGSAVILTPVTTLTSALYKIGDYVTFGWNYTGLSVTPTAVDVVATATVNSIKSTWTLTSNMTFETKGDFTWDTQAYQTIAQNNQQPLAIDTYTLFIYDAESSVTATAGAGSLTANAALTFGLYTGQPYTPLASGWVCGTCSSALSDSDKRALGFMLTMVGITVASFTWFVTGLW